MRAWMFSSVTSRAVPAKASRSVSSIARIAPSIGSVNVAMPRFAATCTESSTLPRLENGDGMSTPRTLARPERLGGDRRRERRIDAARQPEHRARESALARVVARAEDERAPDFGFGADVGGRADRPARRRDRR